MIFFGGAQIYVVAGHCVSVSRFTIIVLNFRHRIIIKSLLIRWPLSGTHRRSGLAQGCRSWSSTGRDGEICIECVEWIFGILNIHGNEIANHERRYSFRLSSHRVRHGFRDWRYRKSQRWVIRVVSKFEASERWENSFIQSSKWTNVQQRRTFLP